MPKYLLPVIALAGISAPAWSAVANDNLELHSQNSVIVTATRIEQSSDSVLAPVTVLERSDIDAIQPVDVVDLLDKVPGATLSRTGSSGSNASLFLRGTNNEHTLFLLNGERISSATLGSTSFQFIDPQQIERIEVLRGPRSSLYGSDAVGGVVQIFTRVAGAHPTAYVSAGYGDHESYRANAGGSSNWNDFRFSGGVSHNFTEGFSSLADKRGANADADAYRNNSLNAAVGYDFTDNIKLDLSHFYTRTKNELDNVYSPSLSPFAESWIQSTRATLDAGLTTWWKSKFSIARSIDDSDTLGDESPISHTHFRTTRKSASWQNDFSLGKQQTLTAGADYYDEQADGSITYTDSTGKKITDRETTGYFAQYLLTYDPVDIQVGARQDHIERFGTETTGNISVGFTLPAQHRLIVSAGSAFRAPTLNNLYWPLDIYDFHGNPNLKAEESKNYEMELRGDYKPLQWALSVYENKIENLIEWAPNPASTVGGWTPTNVANVTIRGGEFNVSTAVAQWRINGRLSYTNPRDDDTNLLLQSRNRRTLGLDAERKFGKLLVGANWLLQDSRFANQANTHELGGFGVVDLHANYDVTSNWQAALRLNNMLNKQYATRATSTYDYFTDTTTWYNYNTERAGWFATITYRL